MTLQAHLSDGGNLLLHQGSQLLVLVRNIILLLQTLIFCFRIQKSLVLLHQELLILCQAVISIPGLTDGQAYIGGEYHLPNAVNISIHLGGRSCVNLILVLGSGGQGIDILLCLVQILCHLVLGLSRQDPFGAIGDGLADLQLLLFPVERRIDIIFQEINGCLLGCLQSSFLSLLLGFYRINGLLGCRVGGIDLFSAAGGLDGCQTGIYLSHYLTPILLRIILGGHQGLQLCRHSKAELLQAHLPLQQGITVLLVQVILDEVGSSLIQAV